MQRSVEGIPERDKNALDHAKGSHYPGLFASIAMVNLVRFLSETLFTPDEQAQTEAILKQYQYCFFARSVERMPRSIAPS